MAKKIEDQILDKKTKEVMHFGSNESKMKKVKKSKLWINLFTKKAVGE